MIILGFDYLEAVANLMRVDFTEVFHLILVPRSRGVRKFGCHCLLLRYLTIGETKVTEGYHESSMIIA
jgi:hypothetical protein